MNNARRKKIEALVSELEDLPSLEGLLEGIQTVLDEEQAAFEGMPESIQNGERGQKAQAAIDALTEARDALQSAGDSIGEAIASLQLAAE